MNQENFDENYNSFEEQKEAEHLDWLIETGNYDAETYNDSYSVRWSYELAYPEDYVGDTIIVDKIDCTIQSEEKISKRGNTYQSNNNMITLYMDEWETKIRIYNEMFNKYNAEKDQLTVVGNHPLAKIMQALTNDVTSNRFIVKYSAFVEKLETLRMKVKIFSYDENGYERYSFDVLNFEEIE